MAVKYEYWFANIKGLSNKEKYQIRSSIKRAEELYYMEEKGIRGIVGSEEKCKNVLESVKNWNLNAEYDLLEKKEVKFITRMNSEYPKRLSEISAPPYVLYVKGKLPLEDAISVAIVGARQCSMYGERMAKEFAETLSDAGIQIISGMARGIDGISQRAAVQAGGSSFAVLGCGVDICYPRENFNLYQDLQINGGVLSEQPIGTQPQKTFFPARNRIISGLADVVLVMEAKEESGSLITADMALEQGKDIYALPGNVTSHLSQGCNRLIKQGSGILISPEDLLNDLGIFHNKKVKKPIENKIVLESTEKLVYSCLDFEPRSLNHILEKTKLQISVLLDHLVMLQLKGYVREVSKNYYVKVK